AGFKRFIGHIEKMPDQVEFVAKAQALGEVGLAIDGPTPLENIKVPYSDLDCVLIMTIKAGMSGQQFNPEYLKKVKTLRRTQGQFLSVEIDGGINDQTIALAIQAGANRFVSSSCIFGSQNPQEQYDLLKIGGDKNGG
ncbi:MAG: ribulose-phosphate 3-epimerase, partial [Candidatus Levybacteria bacterium]|nr:ribulose-phosphate 3-epimerase [Candidatus Levybacteria bacterium]